VCSCMVVNSGFLLVDKPAGITSHDVVAVVRRAARTKRVGHAGTLDPFATGLLVLAVGPCTRLLPYIAGEPKLYEATIRFGEEMNTDDATGVVTRTASCPQGAMLANARHPELVAALAALTGTMQQVPPAFSAKHVNGQRAYHMARKGADLVLPPSTIRVMDWEWLGADGADLQVRVTCGAGTYIRALARDLGRGLDSAAHCHALRRVASGPAHVADAVPMSALTPGAIAEGLIALHNPLGLLEEMAREVLDEEAVQQLRHGRAITASQRGARAALVWQGNVVAMAQRIAGDRWQPKVVLLGDAA